MNIGCINSASKIIATKWSALIIRELADGPRSFCEVERGVVGINPRILCQRLDMLLDNEVIALSGRHYELTTKGHDLLPILGQMATWSEKYPTH